MKRYFLMILVVNVVLIMFLLNSCGSSNLVSSEIDTIVTDSETLTSGSDYATTSATPLAPNEIATWDNIAIVKVDQDKITLTILSSRMLEISRDGDGFPTITISNLATAAITGFYEITLRDKSGKTLDFTLTLDGYEKLQHLLN